VEGLNKIFHLFRPGFDREFLGEGIRKKSCVGESESTGRLVDTFIVLENNLKLINTFEYFKELK